MTESSTNPHLYALIAGELSGDTLGAGLMKAILRHDPQAQFIGIGGPKMCKCGLTSSFKMEELSVMGIFEVIKHLRPILKIRSEITKQLLQARPCVMIGIDSPDFNLSVEAKLKAAGIKTIHYVSPSVWAWREGRMKKIRAACDEVLALLPFEKDFYDKVDMPCTYVGHSLANTIPLESNQKAARERIGLAKNCVDGVGSKVLAILPGSRRGIITRMLPIYASTARILKDQIPDLTLIAVASNRDKAILIKDLWLENVPDLSLTVFVGNGQDVIASADVCLLTSGTVAFETMLLKRPMVVAYKVSAISATIARRLLKVNMFSLPNLLAGREIVKEYIQENCTPFNLSSECLRLLSSDNLLMKNEFTAIHQKIRTNSDELAASVVMRLARQQDASLNAAKTEPQANLEKQAKLPQQDEATASKHSPLAQDKLAGLSQDKQAGLSQDKQATLSHELSDSVLVRPDNKQEAKVVDASLGSKDSLVHAKESATFASAKFQSATQDVKHSLTQEEASQQQVSATTSLNDLGLKQNPESKIGLGTSRVSVKIKSSDKSQRNKLSNDSALAVSGAQAYKYEHDQSAYRNFLDQTQNVEVKHDHSIDVSKMRTDIQNLAQGLVAENKRKPRV